MSYILFGSQTGQAKSIAESTYEVINKISKEFKLCELDEIDKIFLLKTINVAIIICSTTGDGDAPENASKFLRKIKSYPPNSLCQLKYTLLGLGDTNYSQFCNCGKTIDFLLSKAGAKRFYKSSWADDAVGLERVIEPWLDGLYKVLSGNDALIVAMEQVMIYEEFEQEVVRVDHELLGDADAVNIDECGLSVPLPAAPYLSIVYHDEVVCPTTDCLVSCVSLPAAKSDLCHATITDVTRMTDRFAVKTVHKMSLSITKDDHWQWSPGDSIGVLPRNPHSEVVAILARLGVPESRGQCHVTLATTRTPAKMPDHLTVTPSLSMNTSLYSLLTWCTDIRAPLSKAALRVMAEYCNPGSSEQRRLLQLCSKEGTMLYHKCIREPCLPVLDLLNWFPSCTIPIERLLEFLPRLKPRAYSLCDCDTISFAFSKVDIAPVPCYRKRPLTGVCTSWMECMTPTNNALPVYLRKNLNGFTVTSARDPHILIGPGTGVSPYMGFLQYFEKLKKCGEEVGPIWLFFGCRHKDRDFIFKEQMEYYLKENVLTHLCVCFSRDQSSMGLHDSDTGVCVPGNCKYVQDCLLHHAKELSSLVIDNGARVFVCGDASGLAKDVLSTWSTVLLGNHESITSKKEADGFIAKMRINRLYLEDVWL